MFWSISQWILDGFARNLHEVGLTFRDDRMRGNKPMFWLKLHVSVNISVNSRRNYYKPLQTMTRTTTNDDMNHHKSQITTNHHKPWHKPPWTMTETSTKHDMNHYKSPQTMTWTIMMTQKELCIKPYGFLVRICKGIQNIIQRYFAKLHCDWLLHWKYG